MKLCKNSMLIDKLEKNMLFKLIEYVIKNIKKNLYLMLQFLILKNMLKFLLTKKNTNVIINKI